MKANICKTAIAITAAMVLLFCRGSLPEVLAGQWVLTADSEGLQINPDAPIFDIGNMSPGDREMATLKIENHFTHPFTLRLDVVNTSNTPTGSPDLFKQFDFTAYWGNPGNGGVLIADYPNGEGTYFFPEVFMPNSKDVIMTFMVFLPGAETDNEFQSRKASVKYIFTAEALPTTSPGPDGPNDSIPTTQPSPVPGPGLPATPGSLPATALTTEQKPMSVMTETVMDNQPQPEAVWQNMDFDLNSIPAGMLDGDSPDDDDDGFMDIADSDVPMGSYEMPKTGEAPLWHNMLAGSALIFSGVMLYIADKKRGARVGTSFRTRV